MKTWLPLLLLLSACATQAIPVQADASSHAVYDSTRNASADIDRSLAAIAGTDRKLIVAMGANWCHDSRGLAEHFERDAIAPVIARHFDIVWVDVGSPQTGNPLNEDLAARFGVAPLEGTPTVVVLDADGMMLNTEKDARSWRNAHARSPEDVLAYLMRMAAR